MKILLLTLSLLSCSLVGLSQKKTKGGLRIAPTLYIPNDYDPAPGGTITGQIGLSRFVGIGLGFGIIKLQDMKPIIPIGGELVITDFKATKVTPMLTAGISYPAYNESKVTSGSGFSVNTKSSGKIQLQGAAGVLFPSKTKAAFGFSIGYSLVSLSHRIESRTYGTGGSSSKITTRDTDIKMVTASIIIYLK